MTRSAEPVPLTRRFVPVPRGLSSEEDLVASTLGFSTKVWSDLLKEYRNVILADAGAGKTFEMKAQAAKVRAEGRPAFFLRIEDIADGITQAFEMGTSESYLDWRRSTEDGWFFLDSIDEAKLDSPRAFEKAIRRFAAEIHDARHRTRLVLSSRPYAWTETDRKLIEELLPFAASAISVEKRSFDDDQECETSQSDLVGDGKDSWKIYKLAPLDSENIRLFAQHRDVHEIDALITAIERADLWSMAERPFDLDDIFHKWVPGKPLGSRLEILQYGIRRRLQEIEEDRADRQPLNLDRALAGTRRLAAAVTLTKLAGIRVPDGLHSDSGVDAAAVLAEWEPKDIKALLSRAVFNDPIYGAVRFRHREVRELLTAEWVQEQLTSGRGRREVEALIFREQYGEAVITPTMRAILPWLILFDSGIRARALALHPEIATEGGDTAQLPLTERRRLLAEIVAQIVDEKGDRSVQHNESIARIAQGDLADDARALIARYARHDDAIFFLGRLVWQGELSKCTDMLLPIAADPVRGIYARIASARAVLAVGTPHQSAQLWDAILASAPPLDRRLLTELIGADRVEPDMAARVLSAIDRLPPHDRFEVTGLTEALHRLVDKMDLEAIADFIEGLDAYLSRPPHIARGECAVSTEFAWLVGVATHGAERLVLERAEASLSASVLNILAKVPALRHWADSDSDDHKTRIAELVPAWPELNDQLYWTNVRAARAVLQETKGERLTDDWAAAWVGPLWRFDHAAFERLLGYVASETFLDDRLVALTRAHRVYVQEGKPRSWRQKLRAAASNDPELSETIERLFKPAPSEVKRRWLRREQDYKRRRAKQKSVEAENRRAFVAHLKSNPDIVRHPPGLKPGEFSSDQFHLLRTLEREGVRTTRAGAGDWRTLVPEFGEDVARAYRDAALAHWRAYKPGLGSEGASTNSVPYSLIFGMAGLQIEATETENFPAALGELLARHALRYLVWELNGFPRWLESIFATFPDLSLNALWAEIEWELEQSAPGKTLHYILHDVVYHAPWLHHIVAPRLLQWLLANEAPNLDCLRYGIHVLVSGGTDSPVLASLARAKIAVDGPEEQIAKWYALWVDTDADSGVPAVTAWLYRIPDATEASDQAQRFIATLKGGRGRDNGPSRGTYRTAEHLKALYVLMHAFVRAEDDIERAGKGVYSPELRDDAQDGRNALFNDLAAIPGKAAYSMLAALAHDHPDESYRRWMAIRARTRAVADADLQPWTAHQIYEFAHDAERTPSNHRQLFNLTVSRLIDLKDWLERGNDSPAKTYRRVEGETEMRNLVAGWLNLQARGRYTIVQEPEYANAQRSDIWVQRPGVASPVPIELKLVDKGWSGPGLCERLRNQLVGDYLREVSAGCGIMLLIWQGRLANRRWQINNRKVEFSQLPNALEDFWRSIAAGFPGVESIRVVGVDLTVRSLQSKI